MSDFKFKISVISGVYNVEKYLKEMVDSITHQTLGFMKNIELILVDDGSTDESGKLCDEYQKKYPNNIKVIHKENGGISSARNAGLKIASGKYINFCDADDKFKTDAFKKVWNFFEKHQDETDVVCVPVFFFEGAKGENYHNYKFKDGNRIIDLDVEPQMSLFQVNSTFFSSSIKNKFWFDERLSIAEDVNFVATILMEKLKLGAVSNTKYYYRKRKTMDSAIDTSNTKRKYFDETPKYFLDGIRKLSISKFGYIHPFIQYDLLYDLRWRIFQSEETMYYYGIDDEKHNSYLKLLASIVEDCDTKIIANHIRYENFQKLFMINKINKAKIQQDTVFEDGEYNIDFKVNGQKISSIADDVNLGLHFFEIHKTTIKITLSIDYFDLIENYEPYIKINGQYIQLKKINKIEKKLYLGETFTESRFYEIEFDLKDCPLEFYFYLKCDEKYIKLKCIEYKRFFPLSILKESYFMFDKFVLTHNKKFGFIIKKTHPFSRVKYELTYEFSIIKNRPIVYNRKFINLTVALVRMFYFMFHFYFKKLRWLIFDRDYNSGDNGESFLRYLEAKNPNNVVYHFCISKTSTDYARMKEYSNKIIAKSSVKHFIEYLFADDIISSQAEYSQLFAFGNQRMLNDILYNKNFIFLQHGVTNNDISNYINKFKFNVKGFVVVSEKEREIILKPQFYLNNEKIWLTGFPRFDRLEDKSENIISIMPTWRKFLYLGQNRNGRENKLIENFNKSEYFITYNNLINNKKLLSVLKEYNYKLNFVIHPMFYGTERLYTKNEFVNIENSSNYNEIFAKSKILITDYSSVVYDFAYLNKPIIYYQFDIDKMLSGKHSFEINNNYEKEGFGDVIYDENSLIDQIISYIKSNCKIKPKFEQRIDNYFKFHDKNNSERVFNKIIELENKKR